MQNMVEKYEADQWYSLDFIIDWNGEPVPSKYANSKFKTPEESTEPPSSVEVEE